MGQYISQEFVKELLNRVDIVALVKRYVTLKHSGSNNYSGLCPFHSEKTPSMVVSKQKQIFKCFGCGAGGNAITFLKSITNNSYVQVVKELALEHGITLPTRKISQQTVEIISSYRLTEQVSNLYQNFLHKDPDAKPYREYLKQRGISAELAKQFSIGAVPDKWDYIYSNFSSNPKLCQQLLEIGVFSKSEKSNRSFDKFRGRIIFPIVNVNKNIVGFGGRTIANGIPKYLNSPESSIFNKSRELYGIDRIANTDLTVEHVILVEGYMDVVSLQSSGVSNAVASLGTAVNAKHLTMIFDYTDTCVFCFDGDRAGKLAMQRAIEVALPILAANKNIKICELGQDLDPDDYISKYGQERFLKLIKQAPNVIEYFINAKKTMLASPDLIVKANALSELEKSFAQITCPILKELIRRKMWFYSKTKKSFNKTTGIASKEFVSTYIKVLLYLIEGQICFEKVSNWAENLDQNLACLEPDADLLLGVMKNSNGKADILLKAQEMASKKQLYLVESFKNEMLNLKLDVNAIESEVSGCIHDMKKLQDQNKLEILLKKQQANGSLLKSEEEEIRHLLSMIGN